MSGPDTKQAIRATQLCYLCPGHIGPRLQVLRPPQEPPLDLQVHRGRAALESAGHLHILPLGCCHIPRKLGKFCCKTNAPFWNTHSTLDSISCELTTFSWVFKKNKQTKKKNLYDIPEAPSTVFLGLFLVLFLVSSLNHFVVDQIQIIERLTSFPITPLC